MIRFVSLVFAVALLGSPAKSQTPPELQRSNAGATSIPSETPAPVIAPLSVGTAFNASLDDTLDTRKTKAGDTFTAEAVEDVSYQRCMIFAKGTKIVGHVVRVTSAGHGRTGSAIFVQFDKATMKDGQEVILNAGIQALAAGTSAAISAETPKGANSAAPPVPVDDSAGTATDSGDALVVSTLYEQAHGTLPPPLMTSLAQEGEFTPDGLFSPESKGAFGRPDLKVYTPTSEGSHGTVLVSSKKNMHLDAGTHLLLVVQPPPSGDAEIPSPSSTDLDPQ